MFKDLFLESEIVKTPDGRRVVCDPSTREIDTAEMSDYYTKVEAWCAERGVTLDEALE